MRILPFLEPKPPLTQSSSASRSTRAWFEAKCQVSRERFCSETYSSFAACSTYSSATELKYPCRSGETDECSSTNEKREPSSATTSSRQKSEPPSIAFTTRTKSGRSSSSPAGTCTSSPCCHAAALCAVNLSSCQPTSCPSRSCDSSSGSKRISAGARVISMPVSVTTASAATSSATMDGTGTDWAWP